jgi:twitching motility protein PilI
MKGITEKVLSPDRSQDITFPYLELKLGDNTVAGLPMKHAQEVLTIPARRITPMPNMPSCIMGLLNQRSRIFWLIDLSQLLEKQPIDRNLNEYHLAVIRVDNCPLGLIVPQVKGVIRLDLEDIQSPVGNVSPGLVPYLQGCSIQPQGIVLVLDAEAIIKSPLLQSQ